MITKKHRGVDLPTTATSPRITIESGIALPEVPGAVGELFLVTSTSTTYMSDGSTWISMGVAKTPTSSSREKSIAEWAGEKLPNDNDVIYIRRKDNRLFWCEGNKMGGQTWQEINGTGILPTGLKQQIIEGGTTIVSPPIEEVVTTYIPSGWYQDLSANLYHHEGSGVWTDISNTMSKKLTKSAEAGEMEYLG